MSESIFDTLATSHDLYESGIERQQAEVITKAIKNGVEVGFATKNRH